MRRLRTAILTSRTGRAAKAPIQRFLATLGYELAPLNKSYDEFVLALVRRQRVDVLVDVGANQGQYARRFRDRGFAGRIISFEPMREAFDRLASEARSEGRWAVRRVALGDHPSIAELHVAANSVSSSLLPIGTLHVRAEPASRYVRTESVHVSTLDNELASEPSASRFWLKLDVQGYELSALKGCENLLQHFAYVYAECSFVELYKGHALADEIIAWLRERGFILSGVYNLAYDRGGKAVQADFLFTRQSH